MPTELIKQKQIHTEKGCGGTIQSTVDYAKKEVVSVCLKCCRGSVVRNGRVVTENAKFTRIPGQKAKSGKGGKRAK